MRDIIKLMLLYLGDLFTQHKKFYSTEMSKRAGEVKAWRYCHHWHKKRWESDWKYDKVTREG